MSSNKGSENPRLSLFQRFLLYIYGCVYVGDETRPGWKRALPFFVFKCPKHGLVKNYLAGYDLWMLCPLCLEEETICPD
jgi:hypothetical protein